MRMILINKNMVRNITFIVYLVEEIQELIISPVWPNNEIAMVLVPKFVQNISKL